MSLHMRNIPKTDQVYKFTNMKGEIEYIAVQRLANRLHNVNHAVISLALFQEKAYEFKSSIDKVRLLKLTPQQRRTPIIQIKNFGETHIIDGKHRYVRAFLEKQQLIRAYCVEPVIWRQYIVKGVRHEG